MVTHEGKPVGQVSSGDAVIFFNFRPDRASQLVRVFAEPAFDKFAKKINLENMYFSTMTQYQKGLTVSVAFSPLEVKNGLSEVLSQKGLKQFHIAESEKYAHVTSFFNGGRQEPWPGEERDIVTSPGSYEHRYEDVPEMSADKVATEVIEKVKGGTQFILANFANSDMVGHTGNKDACIQAVAALDKNIGLIMQATSEAKACLVITADHGNIEEVVDPRTGAIDKEHSQNPVPLIVAGPGLNLKKIRTKGYLELPSLVPDGVLSDVSPTILELYGIQKPAEMTAVSLLPLLFNQIEGTK